MTGHLVTRVRALGLLIVSVAFGLGMTSGAILARRGGTAVIMTVTATDQIPRELEELGLTDDQRLRVREILRAGRPRVFAVLQEMEPKMRAALETTEAEVEAVLSADQAARWREYRKNNPLKTQQRLIQR